PAARSTLQAQHVQSSGAVVISGERKNELPFTRPVSSRTSAQAGGGPEAGAGRDGGARDKGARPPPPPEGAPRGRRVGSGPSARGGVAAGVGIALAAAGGLLVARNSRRRSLRTAS